MKVVLIAVVLFAVLTVVIWVLRSRTRLGPALDDAQRQLIAERDHVPPELIPFLNVVYKWGATESDFQRYGFADLAEANPKLLQELRQYNDAWTPGLKKIHDDWANPTSLSDNATVARFYFTFLLLDELQFKLPRDENADPVATLIVRLKAPGRSRYWACRMLPDYGDDAKSAIPLLEASLVDPDPAVRIWAHQALARIVGDESTHRAAILQIGQDDDANAIRLEVDSAIEVLDRTSEQHRIEALGSFCITNEVNQIRRLASITQLDGLDHNEQRPMSYAVGNGNTEAVRFLLEHGADPNLPHHNGDSYLHIAAAWRDNAEIIKLLVNHGANVLLRDSTGSTPRDRAKRNRCRSNAELLKNLERNHRS